MGSRGDVYRQVVFFRKDGDAFDVVGVLVGDKEGLYLLHTETHAGHTSLCFAAGQASVYHDGFMVIADVVAVAVAA